MKAEQRHALGSAADDVVAPRQQLVLARLEAVERWREHARVDARLGQPGGPAVEQLAQARVVEPDQLGPMARAGVAGAVVEAVQRERHAVPAEPLERCQLPVRQRPALGGRRIEVVPRHPRAHGDQVGHAGVREDRVEASEVRVPALALDVRPGERELVDSDEEARRAGRLGAEHGAARGHERCEVAALEVELAALHREALKPAHARGRDRARRHGAGHLGAIEVSLEHPAGAQLVREDDAGAALLLGRERGQREPHRNREAGDSAYQETQSREDLATIDPIRAKMPARPNRLPSPRT